MFPLFSASPIDPAPTALVHDGGAAWNRIMKRLAEAEREGKNSKKVGGDTFMMSARPLDL